MKYNSTFLNRNCFLNLLFFKSQRTQIFQTSSWVSAPHEEGGITACVHLRSRADCSEPLRFSMYCWTLWLSKLTPCILSSKKIGTLEKTILNENTFPAKWSPWKPHIDWYFCTNWLGHIRYYSNVHFVSQKL